MEDIFQFANIYSIHNKCDHIRIGHINWRNP